MPELSAIRERFVQPDGPARSTKNTSSTSDRPRDGGVRTVRSSPDGPRPTCGLSKEESLQHVLTELALGPLAAGARRTIRRASSGCRSGCASRRRTVSSPPAPSAGAARASWPADAGAAAGSAEQSRRAALRTTRRSCPPAPGFAWARPVLTPAREKLPRPMCSTVAEKGDSVMATASCVSKPAPSPTAGALAFGDGHKPPRMPSCHVEQAWHVMIGS